MRIFINSAAVEVDFHNLEKAGVRGLGVRGDDICLPITCEEGLVPEWGRTAAATLSELQAFATYCLTQGRRVWVGEHPSAETFEPRRLTEVELTALANNRGAGSPIVAMILAYTEAMQQVEVINSDQHRLRGERDAAVDEARTLVSTIAELREAIDAAVRTAVEKSEEASGLRTQLADTEAERRLLGATLDRVSAEMEELRTQLRERDGGT